MRFWILETAGWLVGVVVILGEEGGGYPLCLLLFVFGCLVEVYGGGDGSWLRDSGIQPSYLIASYRILSPPTAQPISSATFPIIVALYIKSVSFISKRSTNRYDLFLEFVPLPSLLK